jgi:hypothetical protein
MFIALQKKEEALEAHSRQHVDSRHHNHPSPMSYNPGQMQPQYLQSPVAGSGNARELVEMRVRLPNPPHYTRTNAFGDYERRNQGATVQVCQLARQLFGLPRQLFGLQTEGCF